MYLGKIVEQAEKRKVFGNPLHPYTQALLSAVPLPNPKVKREKRILQGDVPSPMHPPPGCPFHTRCPHAQEVCTQVRPPRERVAEGHFTECHFWQELKV
jgi:oligopeptide/dipeptide ABC transporter ATP-binding protein